VLFQRFKSKIWTVAAWGYLLLVLLVWQVMERTGDLWWPGTLLLFSPRWLFALPALLLLPYSIFRNRLLLIPLIVTLIIIYIPFMGLNWSGSSGSNSHIGKPIRIVTCNIHSGEFNQKKLETMIRDTAADIVTLQEVPSNLLLIPPKGWQMIVTKGFAILSRYPLTGTAVVTMPPPGEKWLKPQMLQTIASTDLGALAVCSVHLPTPRFGLQEIFDRKTLIRPSRKGRLLRDTVYRREVAKKVNSYISQLDLPVIVAGDFNTPSDSRLFQEVWGSYRNAFDEKGRGYGWTQRVRFSGLRYSSRIDHILTSSRLMPLTSAVGSDVGSDHLPLIADITIANKEL
jgi:endonuclease/exonuclease/phosphatase family metal-dependent hydrolase